MDASHYLEDIERQFRRLKRLAEAAVGQLSEEEVFVSLDPEENSIAIIIKHMAGNMRSRWRDFLVTDGEKPDRHRDTEFTIEAGDSYERLIECWQEGWRYLFDALGSLTASHLTGTVYIRGEPHSVVEAIHRQLCHYAYHVGQIVFLARHLAGSRWQTLSIARGRSQAFNDALWKKHGSGKKGRASEE